LHEPKLIELELARFYVAHKGKVGAPILCAGLKADGFTCSVSKVSRLMKKANLRTKLVRKFRTTTDMTHKLLVAANHLNRHFKVAKLNQVRVGDIGKLVIALIKIW
jgi:transposase InsO family protein